MSVCITRSEVRENRIWWENSLKAREREKAAARADLSSTTREG